MQIEKEIGNICNLSRSFSTFFGKILEWREKEREREDLLTVPSSVRTNTVNLKYTLGPAGKSRNDSNKNIITQL